MKLEREFINEIRRATETDGTRLGRVEVRQRLNDCATAMTRTVQAVRGYMISVLSGQESVEKKGG